MHISVMWQLSNHTGYPKRLAIGFVCVVFVASAVSTLLLIDRFRSYRADIDILLLSKSVLGALETEATRDALILLGSKDDFLYDVNELVSVSGVEIFGTGKGSLRIRVSAENPVDARDGAFIASQKLFSLTSRYYDIRKNTDIRSIATPRVEGTIPHPILLLISGMVSGVLFSVIFFLILLSLARIAFSFRKEESFPISGQVFSPAKGTMRSEREEAPHSFSPDAFVPKKPDAKFFSFESSGADREKDYAHFNRGPAPTNLPIAQGDADVFPHFLFPENPPMKGNDGIIKKDVEMPVSPIEPMIFDTPLEELPPDHEPTEAEYKERLNNLLKGKMPK